MVFAILSSRWNVSPLPAPVRDASSFRAADAINQQNVTLRSNGPASQKASAAQFISTVYGGEHAPGPLHDPGNTGSIGQAAIAPAVASGSVPGAQSPDLLTAALTVSLCTCVLLAFALTRMRTAYRTESARMQADLSRLELAEKRYRLMTLNSDVLVFELNFSDRTIEADESFESLLGQNPDPDNSFTIDRIHPDDRPEFQRLLREAADSPESVTGELRLLDKSNKYAWFSLLLSSFPDRQGNAVRVIGKLTDIDREKREKALLELRAKTDMMTGLFNKSVTERMISLSLFEHPHQTDALLILDVDNLKIINDTLGHAEGDKAIRKVAETLKTHFRSTDIIGRVGGDEFIAFLRNIGSESKLRNSLSSLIQKLSRIRLGETHTVQLNASIGAVVSTEEDSFESLYKKADKAMYYVKRHGKNDYAFYSPEMEHVNYRFTGNVPVSPVRSDIFDVVELDQILSAIAIYFTLVIFVNLTKNTYYIIDCEYKGRLPNDAGIYEHFVGVIGNIFYPNHKEEFAAAFGREALLSIHGQGERRAAFEAGHDDGQGAILRTQTTAVFVQPELFGDICAIILIHES
ncbi:MAG: diguanylate cyclase domain-containing protein [Christensenellales bacterium]